MRISKLTWLQEGNELPQIFLSTPRIAGVNMLCDTAGVLMKKYFTTIAEHHGLNSPDVVDHLANGVFVVGPDTNFHYANKHILQKFSLKPEDLQNRSFLDFIDPADREYAHSVFRMIIEGENASPFVLRYRHGDHAGTVEVRAHRLSGKNGIAGVIGAVHTVEDRPFREVNALSLLERIPYPVGIFSLSGIVSYINPAFTNFFGYTLEEVGTFDAWFANAYPDEKMRAKLRSEWEKDLAEIQVGMTATKTLEVTCKGGSKKSVIMNIVFVRPEKIFLFVEENRDRAVEAAILEKRIRDVQQTEPISVVAGMIAHDFNNILSGILGNISLLESRCSGDPHTADIIKDLESFAKQGVALSGSLLALVRGSEIEKRICDINEIVRESARIFGRLHGEIRIHLSLCDEPCHVLAVPTQIEQVLLNLFINAHQAMPDGGAIYLATSIAEIGEKPAAQTHIKPGKYALISVCDTGCGMDARTLKKIFEPFFSTKEKGIGIGLGLTSAREIIKKHGGTITVESTPNVGTVFVIALPLVED